MFHKESFLTNKEVAAFWEFQINTILSILDPWGSGKTKPLGLKTDKKEGTYLLLFRADEISILPTTFGLFDPEKS